jgi:hypothetical protein
MNYRSFWIMVLEITINMIVMPPTVDIFFEFYYLGVLETYTYSLTSINSIDQFTSVLALFRTSFFFVRALLQVSKFNDCKAYETW